MKNLSIFLFIFSLVFLFLMVPRIGADVQTYNILDVDYNTDKAKLFPYLIGATILIISIISIIKGKRFIPLMVNSTQALMSGPSKYIREQQECHDTGDDFLLEVIYTNGTRLSIKSDPDLDHLRSLICLLG